MKATFQNTVDILVKAYLNNTLEHGDCGACAVGNLVSAAIGPFEAMPPYLENGKVAEEGIGWPNVFCTIENGYQIIRSNKYEGLAKEQIDSTGYSRQDLARIEEAFEYHNHTYTRLDEDQAMFEGLMAVVDVLADIHGINLEAKESAKALFVKA